MSFRFAALALSATLVVSAAACSDVSPPTAPRVAPPTTAARAIDPAVTCTGATMPVVECEALVALFNSTNGPSWYNHIGWGTNPNPCEWQGVTCTADDHGSVKRIKLWFEGLTGPLPSELGNLSSLELLDLGGNYLTGAIPASLGNLANLDTLSLFENELSGSIPASLGNLPNLRGLHLSDNELSGAIPASLGNLPKIGIISLSRNNLSGSIPASFGNMSTLTWLLIENNSLTGPIPSELGNLANLELLSLSRNQLTGTIPASFANLDKLNHLGVGLNQLSGPVPDVLMQMATLDILHLWENQFSGVLSVQLATHLEGFLWCQLETGNPDLIIPDAQPYRDADDDGDGKICFKPMSSADDIGEDAIDEIEELVPAVLNPGQANALQTKIDNAMEKAAKGQFNAAINQMQAFLGQLADMVAAGTLTPAQAAPFIAQAQALIAIWTAEL